MKERLINMEDINRKNNGYVGADDSVRPLLKKNTQRGITLVALVITIIVLLILAMVSIRIVMDGGLIIKSKEATAQHTIGTEKEAIQTGYAAYQIELAQKGTAELKVEGEGEAKVTPKGEDWDITFTKTNNEYELKKDGTVTLTKQGNGSTTTASWTDNGDDTFTNGKVTVKVGDIVNYDEGIFSTTVDKSQSGYDTNQEYTTKDLGWRVLGISAKGEIELISDNPTNSVLYLSGVKGYLNAEDVLNNLCNELYGQGTNYVTGARSLNVEDINKLGNYDPTTYSGYRDIWTYRFPTSGNYMQYKTTKSDGTLVKDWTDITDSDYQTFRMPGETETISADNRNNTGKSLEDTFYSYRVADKIKQITSDGKKMSDIISNGTGSSEVAQWLASREVEFVSGYARFHVRRVGEFVHRITDPLCTSCGYFDSCELYVRHVVTLKSDIQLTGDSNSGWQIIE